MMYPFLHTVPWLVLHGRNNYWIPADNTLETNSEIFKELLCHDIPSDFEMFNAPVNYPLLDFQIEEMYLLLREVP